MTDKRIKLTITLSEQADDRLRKHNRKKGDMSKIIENLILRNLPDLTEVTETQPKRRTSQAT